MENTSKSNAVAIVESLGGIIANDLDSPSPTCVLCTHRPCDCPPFGTAEYFALLNRRHGVG